MNIILKQDFPNQAVVGIKTYLSGQEKQQRIWEVLLNTNVHYT